MAKKRNLLSQFIKLYSILLLVALILCIVGIVNLVRAYDTLDTLPVRMYRVNFQDNASLEQVEREAFKMMKLIASDFSKPLISEI